MIVAGILRLGRYTRFVSHSVMLGFLTGIAVNIIFGQLSDLTGAPAAGGDQPGQGDRRASPTPVTSTLASLLVGVSGRWRSSSCSATTRLAIVERADRPRHPDRRRAASPGSTASPRSTTAARSPAGCPLPSSPTSACCRSSLVAGGRGGRRDRARPGRRGRRVGAEPRRPDRTPTRTSSPRASATWRPGCFGGMPVGGSVGQTALNVTAGARTRWAAILSGVWMLVILVAFSGGRRQGGDADARGDPDLRRLSGRSGRTRCARSCAPDRTRRSRVISTFVATLLLPVAAAVGVGVVLSLLLQLNQEAMDLAVVESGAERGGRLVEETAADAPAQPRR